MKHAVAFFVAASFVIGCSAERAPTAASAEPAASAAPKADATSSAKPREKTALSQTKFGEPIAAGAPTDLKAIAAEPAKFAGQKVRTEGVVTAVCKSAGCWMEIGDAAGLAHVKMASHAFYVPKNADGHRARIEGTVQAGAPKDECGSKDSCGGEDNGALAKVEIEATGVEFLD